MTAALPLKLDLELISPQRAATDPLQPFALGMVRRGNRRSVIALGADNVG